MTIWARHQTHQRAGKHCSSLVMHCYYGGAHGYQSRLRDFVLAIREKRWRLWVRTAVSGGIVPLESKLVQIKVPGVKFYPTNLSVSD